MSDLEIKDLVAKMAERTEQQQAQIMQQQQQITGLITAIRAMPGIDQPVNVTVQPAVPAAAVIRAEKVQRLPMGS